MGVMYYAEYLHLFERGRSEFIRERGISYSEIEKRGYLLPVREAACRYRSPCRYDDLIWIRIGIAELGRASLRFVYEIRNEDKSALLASGETQHALVNSDMQPQRMPGWLTNLLTGANASS